MSGFLPLFDDPQNDLVEALTRIGPIIVPSRILSTISLPRSIAHYVLFDQDTIVTLDDLISYLDSGADKLILPSSLAKSFLGAIPANRLLLLLDARDSSAVPDSTRNGVSGVLLKTPAIDVNLITSVSRFFTSSSIYIWAAQSHPPNISLIRQAINAGASVVLPTSQLTIGASTTTEINIADAFLAPLVSDRLDGLFPTVVSGTDGRCLGLVYSSAESVKESILTGKGVYQSRKHGLWRKGDTSGATQEVVSIRTDCDSDSLEFTVVQHGSGFCHLNRTSCFGDKGGILALEKTLQSRLASAPEGSYTKRLFDDPELLRSKIMEEADELCRAKTNEEIAFEAADLLYFTLTRCVAAGVNFTDIERSLDQKAKKVSRRLGNAKPQWTASPPQPAAPQPPPTIPTDPSAPIKMSTTDLSLVTPSERTQLLRRPVLNSSEMISKVKPIVDKVRTGGDAALLQLTAKFDKASLSSTILPSPFPAESMLLPDHIRLAIDSAYANIHKFHKAQAESAPLVVETTPGVVCSRFARPIARVGLYIPGGTAILPSTALMLGIPAQVAGCHTIVFATPPRPDGSISPEVVYVAHLVGASAIVTAGGAQAIAAMAYGTETVPKVDKIFGPGNQWVTAAKMMLQNDTDALISIDMPAGPSEVLVIADETCNPAFVAADLLSQAEHGVDSQVVLAAISLSPDKLAAIESEIDAQARKLSRVDIIRQSIAKSIIVKASSVEQAIEFSNDYAPEHLILHIRDASEKLPSVANAGSVFVGHYSPESCGDYASGTNHTLPTNGYARQFSGVNTLSFQKHITSQEITQDGLKVLGPIVATLADCEGLDAHAQAVRIRLSAINA